MHLLSEIVRSTLLTGHLIEHDPVSLLFIAAPESGKTSIVLANKCPSAIPITDITGRGLQKICSVRPEIRHIIVNDLIAVASHKPSVSQYTLAMLNAMTEEGLQTIVTPETIEKFEHASGRRGIITSITLEVLKDGRKWWNKIGMTSRMLPICFKLSSPAVIEIKSQVDGDSKQGIVECILPVPKKLHPIFFPKERGVECRFIADERARHLGEIGIRRLKQYRAMARGHALLAHRANVTKEDIDFLANMDAFVSFSSPREVNTCEAR